MSREPGPRGQEQAQRHLRRSALCSPLGRSGWGDGCPGTSRDSWCRRTSRARVASKIQPGALALLRGPHPAEVAGRRRQPAGGYRPPGLPLPARLQPEALPEPRARRAARGGGREPRHRSATTQSTCTPDAKRGPNFDPLANVDDGSCTDGQHANFSFGAFSRSARRSRAPEGGRLCAPYTILEPAHRRTSCPANYTASLLSSEVKVWSERSYQC